MGPALHLPRGAGTLSSSPLSVTTGVALSLSVDKHRSLSPKCIGAAVGATFHALGGSAFLQHLFVAATVSAAATWPWFSRANKRLLPLATISFECRLYFALRVRQSLSAGAADDGAGAPVERCLGKRQARNCSSGAGKASSRRQRTHPSRIATVLADNAWVPHLSRKTSEMWVPGRCCKDGSGCSSPT